MRPFLFTIFLLGISLFSTSRSEASRIAAFVVGIDDYPTAPLDNAVNDATAIHRLLVDQLLVKPSQVVLTTNPDRLQFFEDFERFRALSKGAEIVMIYFAGHGMESLDGSENFLLPTDIDVASAVESEAHLRAGGINLKRLTADLARTTSGAKVFILDCCRHRPASRGMIKAGGGMATNDDQIPADTLMLLAAAPNRAASDGSKNGPFTRALLDILPRPDQSLLDAFFAVSDQVQEVTTKRQIPWMRFDGSGRIFRESKLFPASGGAPAPEMTTPVNPVSEEPERYQSAALAPVVKLDTNFGDIYLRLDREKAPRTVQNFLDYVNDSYYDRAVFHRSVASFMIQGGGYKLDPHGQLLRKTVPRPPIESEGKNGLMNRKGTIAMARSQDPHSADLQFFFNLKDNAMLDAPAIDGWGQTVFGEIIEGMNVVERMAQVPTSTREVPSIDGPITLGSLPNEWIYIKSARVLP
ncbi:MAG: peptidylprolyl isomerase [Verrucomicrobiota bacterium]